MIYDQFTTYYCQNILTKNVSLAQKGNNFRSIYQNCPNVLPNKTSLLLNWLHSQMWCVPNFTKRKQSSWYLTPNSKEDIIGRYNMLNVKFYVWRPVSKDIQRESDYWKSFTAPFTLLRGCDQVLVHGWLLVDFLDFLFNPCLFYLMAFAASKQVKHIHLNQVCDQKQP